MKNDELTGTLFVIILVLTVIALIVKLIAMVAIFVSLALTVVSMCAWANGLTLGDTVITPEEARAFVMRGVGGAFFALITTAILKNGLHWHFLGQDWGLVAWTGYAFGSVGATLEEEIKRKELAEAHQEVISPIAETHPVERPDIIPARPVEPFQFAFWDDGDIRQ